MSWHYSHDVHYVKKILKTRLSFQAFSDSLPCQAPFPENPDDLALAAPYPALVFSPVSS
jgi:hypothetical protein